MPHPIEDHWRLYCPICGRDPEANEDLDTWGYYMQTSTHGTNTTLRYYSACITCKSVIENSNREIRERYQSEPLWRNQSTAS